MNVKIKSYCIATASISKFSILLPAAMTTLFDSDPNARPTPGENLLPYDGAAYLYPGVLQPAEADRYYLLLRQQAAWQADEGVLYGRPFRTERQVAWYGDRPYSYRYAGYTHTAHNWIAPLLALKAHCESVSNSVYHACLLNLYPTGAQGMGWHADDEPELVPQAPIAALSLGAERRFDLKHRATGYSVQLLLPPGSLLVMRGATQQHWLHRLPPTRRVHAPRISLTFRQMVAAR